jgi:Flp pilus assembly protein TadB
LWLIAPDYISFLFENPGGQRILALAVLLLSTGIGTMRFMIRKALS